MSQWISLAEADLRPYLNATQWETLSARPEAVEDPVDVSLYEATSRVRAEVRSQNAALLSPDEDRIPPELEKATALRALVALERRVPGLLLTAEQLNELAETVEQLASVRAGTFVIAAADDAPAPPPPSIERLLETTTRRESRLTSSRLLGL